MKGRVVILTFSLLFLVLIVIVSISTVGSKQVTYIQDIPFQGVEGYQNVSKKMILTNDDTGFYINGERVPEELRIGSKVTLNIEVENDSAYETSIHFHGINGDSSMDGVGGISQDNIKPGESYTYSFNLTDPGTYMYHAHVDSANQVNNENLYGGLVVEDETKTNSDMLILNTNINNMDEHHYANQTFETILFNGENEQTMNIDNDENIYLNIANLSSAPLSIDFGKDINFRILSIDANDANSEWNTNKSIIVPTAQRFIVEIENPRHSFQISTSVLSKQNATYNIFYKSDTNIVKPDITKNDNLGMMGENEYSNFEADSTLIYNLVETVDNLNVRDKEPDVKSAMTLSMSSGLWVINDKAFPKTDTINVTEGDVVEITLTNTAGMTETHPFHLHGHKFEVVAVNGQPVTKNLVLDTIDVEPSNEVTIRFNADNPGIWAFHCHNLIHAGMGMMTTLNYEGYDTKSNSNSAD